MPLHRTTDSSFNSYDGYLGIKDNRSRFGAKLARVTLLVILIIGSLGAAGVLPGATTGWTALGLGIAYTLFKCGGKLHGRSLDVLSSLLISTAVITLGALGGTGTLSGLYTGSGLIGVVALTALVFGSIAYCNHNQQQTQQHRFRTATGFESHVEPEG